MYIDTHAHIYEEDFASDIEEVIKRAQEAGAIKILLPPTNRDSTLKALELSRRFQGICYPMIGLHPEDVDENYIEELNSLELILEINKRKEFVAIGEIGLDYYHSKTFKKEQLDAFKKQIAWASEYNFPLMIHARNASDDLLNCLRPWRDKLPRGGVFHCFTGSIETAHQLLDFHPGFYLGIGGVLTFKNAHLAQVVKQIPLDRIVLETDSPYMAPVPMRGKRNEPSFIPHIITALSQATGATVSEIESITTQNAQNLFF